MLSQFTPAHRGGSGTPLVLLHGFTGSWRTWELVLPALERDHDVLAPTLVGHAGGPRLDGEVSADVLPDAIERAMDAAGFETAHMPATRSAVSSRCSSLRVAGRGPSSRWRPPAAGRAATRRSRP